MRKYNRALDYVALGLNELRAGKAVLAARLFAKASEQEDVTSAIGIIEASNKQAFANQQKVVARKRLKANDEFPFEDGEGEGELAADLEETDPLDEVADADTEEEMVESDFDEDDDEDEDDAAEETSPVTAAAAMARVLAGMKRRR